MLITISGAHKTDCSCHAGDAPAYFFCWDFLKSWHWFLVIATDTGTAIVLMEEMGHLSHTALCKSSPLLQKECITTF